MDMFDLYKPLRNYLRDFSLIPSLENIWHLSQYQMMGKTLPRHLQFGSKTLEGIFPWNLDILAKELILNAEGRKKLTFGNLSEIAKCINFIRDIENGISNRTHFEDDHIFFEMHRLLHKQFPMQIKPNSRYLVRYYKLFSDDKLKSILLETIGLTARELMLMSFATMGHNLNHSFIIDSSQDFSVAGVSKEQSQAYFNMLTGNLFSLKEAIKENQQYNENWQYTFNPLVAKPLISFDSRRPEFLLCPLPAHIHARPFEGLFYNLHKVKGFDNAYGQSFQRYVGEVLKKIFNIDGFKLYSESEYYHGDNRKDGVDWILSDNTAHMFIECKTKRMTLNGKFSLFSEEFYNDLRIMAEAVVQSYKNIQDARNGRVEWKPDGKPIFPLIITLESWLMFTPPVYAILLEKIKALLSENNISEFVLEEMPFTITSIDEFEVYGQIIPKSGICPYLNKKIDTEHNPWLMSAFTNKNFSEEVQNIKNCLFDDSFDELIPKKAM